METFVGVYKYQYQLGTSREAENRMKSLAQPHAIKLAKLTFLECPDFNEYTMVLKFENWHVLAEINFVQIGLFWADFGRNQS